MYETMNFTNTYFETLPYKCFTKLQLHLEKDSIDNH